MYNSLAASLASSVQFVRGLALAPTVSALLGDKENPLLNLFARQLIEAIRLVVNAVGVPLIGCQRAGASGGLRVGCWSVACFVAVRTIPAEESQSASFVPDHLRARPRACTRCRTRACVRGGGGFGVLFVFSFFLRCGVGSATSTKALVLCVTLHPEAEMAALRPILAAVNGLGMW